MARALDGMVLLLWLLVGCADGALEGPAPACDSLRWLEWVDCEPQATAPAPSCSPASTSYLVQGRASNYDRMAALVCCSKDTCSATAVWSVEPDRVGTVGAAGHGGMEQ